MALQDLATEAAMNIPARLLEKNKRHKVPHRLDNLGSLTRSNETHMRRLTEQSCSELYTFTFSLTEITHNNNNSKTATGRRNGGAASKHVILTAHVTRTVCRSPSSCHRPVSAPLPSCRFVSYLDLTRIISAPRTFDTRSLKSRSDLRLFDPEAISMLTDPPYLDDVSEAKVVRIRKVRPSASENCVLSKAIGGESDRRTYFPEGDGVERGTKTSSTSSFEWLRGRLLAVCK